MGWFFGDDDEVKPIDELINELSDDGPTALALKGLDYIVPGEWTNYTDFDEMLREVTGDDDEEFLEQVKERVMELYNDEEEGYQTAMRIFQLVDTADVAMGSAALADKLADSFSMFSFMEDLTPKADYVQAVDLGIKIVAEILAFAKLNGLPGDSIGDFVEALADYAGDEKMRLAALVCFDGLIPLGPDFVDLALEKIQELTTDTLEENETFQKVQEYVPGDEVEDKLGFVQESFNSVADWMRSFVDDNGIDYDGVLENLREYVELADDHLDYLAAFLDLTTAYFEHTGTQTVARKLIDRAAGEV